MDEHVCVDERGRKELLLEDVESFPEGELIELEVTSRGLIESRPYLTHGLMMRAVKRSMFTDPTAAQWNDVVAEATAAQAIAATTSVSWGAANGPLGLALGSGTDVTVLVDGEIYLEAGMWRFELRGDDAGFFDLAPPGTADFRRVIAQSGPTAATVTEVIPAAGWYPMRLVAANMSGSGNAILRGAMGAAALAAFDTTRVRAYVDGRTRGILQETFVLPRLLRPTVSKIIPSPLDISFGMNVPPDSGLTTVSSFSVRFTGQFLVEGSLDGFTLSTIGGHRAWIDGRPVADKVDALGRSTSVISRLALSPGWHDVILELHKNTNGDASLTVTNLVGDPTAFSQQKLRPVLGVNQRWLGSNVGGDQTIPEQPVTLARPVVLPDVPGKVTGGSIEMSVTHPAHVELLETMSRGAAQVTLLALGGVTGTDFLRRRMDISPALFPTLGGAWTFGVTDGGAPGTNIGTLLNVSVTALYDATSALSAPFAQIASYTSAPLDLGDVVWIDRAELGLEREDPTVSLSMRSAGTLEDLSLATWQAVASGASAGLAPRRFVQFRVGFSSPTAAVAIDKFRLVYYTQP